MHILKHSFAGLIALSLTTCLSSMASADSGDDSFNISVAVGVPWQHPVITPLISLSYEITEWFGITLSGRFGPREPGYLWAANLGVVFRKSLQHFYVKGEINGGVFSLMGRDSSKTPINTLTSVFFPKFIEHDMLTGCGEATAEIGYTNTDSSFFIGPQARALMAPTGNVAIGTNKDLVVLTFGVSATARFH